MPSFTHRLSFYFHCLNSESEIDDGYIVIHHGFLLLWSFTCLYQLTYIHKFSHKMSKCRLPVQSEAMCFYSFMLLFSIANDMLVIFDFFIRIMKSFWFVSKLCMDEIFFPTVLQDKVSPLNQSCPARDNTTQAEQTTLSTWALRARTTKMQTCQTSMKDWVGLWTISVCIAQRFVGFFSACLCLCI